MNNSGLKVKTFVPVSFDDITGTQYATWLAKLKLLSWDEGRKESE